MDRGGVFSIYNVIAQDLFSFSFFGSLLSIFPILFFLSVQEDSPYQHASHSSSISYTAFPSMTSLVFISTALLSPFSFQAAVHALQKQSQNFHSGLSTHNHAAFSTAFCLTLYTMHVTRGMI